MGICRDLTGRKFNRWTVLSRGPNFLVSSGPESAWHCKCECGTQKLVRGKHLTSGRSQSCGCRSADKARGRRGPLHHNWKGGRLISSQGYVYVLDPDHPNSTATGYVAEHILVLSRVLKRPLLSSETVHHKNGVRDDNRAENLELWDARHPAGQRVIEKCLFYASFLQEHGYTVFPPSGI